MNELKIDSFVYVISDSYSKKYDVTVTANSSRYNIIDCFEDDNVLYYHGLIVSCHNGPAVKFPCGTLEYRINGLLHRSEGPAVEFSNGDKEWWLNGKLHREDGPALEYVNRYKAWYKNGQLHREDGPALIHHDGSKEYFQYGQRHREGAPAIEYSIRSNQYWMHGKNISEDILFTKNELLSNDIQPINDEKRLGYYEYNVDGMPYTTTKLIFVDINGTYIITDNGKKYINFSNLKDIGDIKK